MLIPGKIIVNMGSLSEIVCENSELTMKMLVIDRCLFVEVYYAVEIKCK